MKIKILYEDKNILGIDKPYGISVHPDGKNKEKTITDWILKNYPEIEKVGEPFMFQNKIILRPGIVHRLDKNTSGILILAKNQKAYEFLKNQFKNREIKKVYHAIVSGWIKNDYGIINKPIGKSPSDFRKRLAGRGAKGELKEAITEYKVLKRFEDNLKNKFTYIELKIKTGRTHQIRVHMKFLNYPITGDELYNANKVSPKGINRMALHAKSLEFTNLEGEKIKIISPLPKEFSKI